MLQKLRLGCKKKTHGFVVYSVTHRMRSPPPPPTKKVENYLFEFWRSRERAVMHAVTYLSSDGGGT